MGSGVSKAYAMIDGVKVVASYNEADDLWVIEANAPSESSWNLPGHVYGISLHAEDEAGNTVSMDSSDPTYGDQLKVRVLEKTPPTVSIVQPTSMSVIGVNYASIKLSAIDFGGSGLNFASAVFKVNDVDKTSELEWSEVDGVQVAEYTAIGLNDGTNSIEFSMSDNDGNESSSSVTFVVSTKAPTLELTSPAEGVITNGETITISGSSSIDTEGVTIVSVTVNGSPLPLEEDGSFDYEYPLSEGENVLTIIVTDSAGNKTQIIRHVERDSAAPVITDVTVEPTVVDASGMIRITFRVTDPG